MNFYAGTLGQLLIVELFVLWIWFRVLLETMNERDVTTRELKTSYRKLLLTAGGLVLNALAIAGVMMFRISEFLNSNWPFATGVVPFYALLVIGNFMFMLSACLGNNTNLLKIFAVVTAIWTTFILTVDIEKLLN